MISLEDPMKKIEVKVEEGILAGEEKTTRMIFISEVSRKRLITEMAISRALSFGNP